MHNCCLYRQVEVLETVPPPPQTPTIMNDVQSAPDDTGAGTSTPPSRTGTQTPPTGHDTNPALRTRKTEGFAVEAMNTDPGIGRPVPAGLSAPTAANGAPVISYQLHVQSTRETWGSPAINACGVSPHAGICGVALHTAAVLNVTSSADVAPGPTEAVPPAVNTAASSAVLAPGQTGAVEPLPKKMPRSAVSRASAVDPLATVPPPNGTQEGSGRGQGPGCHTLLHDEMESADLATGPMLRCMSVYAGTPRAGKVTAAITADAAAQARPPRWCRAGNGGRFGSTDERNRYYFDKSVEVRRNEVLEWIV